MTQFSKTIIEYTRGKTRVLSITPNKGTRAPVRDKDEHRAGPSLLNPHLDFHSFPLYIPSHTSTTTGIISTNQHQPQQVSAPSTTDNHQTQHQTTWVAHHPKSPLPASRNVLYSMVAIPAHRVSATSHILSQRPRHPRPPILVTHGAQVKQLDRKKPLRPTPAVVSLDNLRCSLRRLNRSARNSFRKRKGSEDTRSIPGSDVGVR